MYHTRDDNKVTKELVRNSIDTKPGIYADQSYVYYRCYGSLSPLFPGLLASAFKFVLE